LSTDFAVLGARAVVSGLGTEGFQRYRSAVPAPDEGIDMRCKPAVLATAFALSLAGGVVGAAPASAGPDGPDPHSLNGQCTSATAGLHYGWDNGAGRNVGGTCGAV
jgi:hypothetical protein